MLVSAAYFWQSWAHRYRDAQPSLMCGTRLRPSCGIHSLYVRLHHLLQVVLTDLAQVLPVMQRSIDLNGLSTHR